MIMKKKNKAAEPVNKTISNKADTSVSTPIQNNFSNWLGIAIVIILGLMIYSNSFDCSFHFDDKPNIIDNETIHKLDIPAIWNSNQNRFMANLSFALNYHYGELEVWGYHLVNLIIHLINSCLIYWLVWLVFSTPVMSGHEAAKNKNIIAFLAALLFVSHPLATQSVTYIVQRLASMVTMFYLLSLALYIKGRLTEGIAAKITLFTGATLAGILAMLTKENSFTLPFSILLFEMCFLQTQNLKINFKDKRIWLVLGVFVIVGLVVVKRFSLGVFKPLPPAFGNDYTLTSSNYLMTQFSVLIKYIQLMTVPINQTLDYDFPIAQHFFEARTLISFIILLSLLILAVYLFNKQRIISFGIFWFFITLSIESSIIPIADVIFEHRTYLPMLGFLLALMWCVYIFIWKKSKFLAIAICLILVMINARLTFARNKLWIDQMTLLNDEIEKAPEKARPLGSRADLYRDAKQFDLALADYDKALVLSPTYATGYHNRGGVYDNLNQLDKAYADFSKAIQYNKEYIKAYYNRATILTKMNRPQEAIVDFNKLLELDSTYENGYINRGIAHMNLGDATSAIKDYTKALQLNPNILQAYYNRASSYDQINQKELAIKDLDKLIELDPQNKNAYYNRGIYHGALKQYQQAIADYSKVIEIDPRFIQAYVNRGVNYTYLEQWDKAIEEYNKALKIDPNFKLALSNRDFALSRLKK